MHTIMRIAVGIDFEVMRAVVRHYWPLATASKSRIKFLEADCNSRHLEHWFCNSDQVLAL